MEHIKFALQFLAVLVWYIVVIRILMEIANFVGERFGLGRAFTHLWEKKKK